MIPLTKSLPYSRIILFGKPGSGKSTFAAKLHTITQLPLHHLDRYFFKENWIERDYQEFLNIQQHIVAQDSWIIDGNSLKSLEMRYQRAQLCLYFNYPRWLCYWRIFKRFFTKNKTSHDRALGCKETIQWKLLTYTWNFEIRVESLIKKLRARYPEVQFIEIKNDKELLSIEKQLFGNSDN